MDKFVFAVDFDGCIVEDKYPEIGDPMPGAFETLIGLKKAGHKLILNTCRTNEFSFKKRKVLNEAVAFCKKNGIVFDAVNENLPEIIQKYGCDTRKISADYYIDDKNFGTHVVNFKLISHTFNI